MNLCPHETNISESAKDFDINWRRIAPIFPEGSLATLLLLPEKSEPAKELRDDFIMLQCQQPGEARQPGVLFSYSRLSYNGREIGLTRL